MHANAKFFAALLLALVGSTSQAAIVVSLSALGVTTTGVAGAITETFDPDGACTGDIYSSCAGNYSVLPGTIPQAAQPAGAAANFLSVPNPLSNGTATLTLYGPATYFGLLWGSMDAYNTISFYSGATLIEDYTGTDIVGLFANGNQISLDSNRYVNFLFTGGQTFDRIDMTSTQFAFESDNHAIAPVPLPAAAWLLLSGLAGMGFVGRRRKNV